MVSLIEKELENVIKDEDLWKGRNVKDMFSIKLQKTREELKKKSFSYRVKETKEFTKVVKWSEIEEVLGK